MGSRRASVLFACATLFWMLTAFAQKPSSVLDWKTEYTVNTSLIQRMHRQYDSRRSEFSLALQSRRATAAYVDSCRARFRRLIGNLPAASPLNPTVAGTVPSDGYIIEKLLFESFQRHHVSANLYRPDGKGPFPAALLFCGHEDASKATESYQKTAILLARSGFVVLVVDPISQSERHQITDQTGKPLTRGGTTEHTLLNATSNLLGTSTAAYELWDNIRSLDYLITRPDVDTSRIGCLGNSGGGIQTMYFSAFDRRVKVAAVCSYLASRERTLELSGPADGCAQIPDEGKFQLEMSDYLIAASPNPLLILAGRYDFIDFTGTEAAFNDLKNVYAVLGHPQKVSMFTYDDGHGFSRPKREAAVAWFRRWLCNDPSPVTEQPSRTLTAADLLCAPTGQINSSVRNEVTIPEHNLELFETLAHQRQAYLRKGKEQKLLAIRNLLSIEKTADTLAVERLMDARSGDATWQRFIVRKRGRIPIPVLVAYPEGSPGRVLVWLHGRGKERIADSTTLIQSSLKRGYALVLCDILGTGETEDKPELNDPKYYNAEYRNAMLALHVGHSLVGQRTDDISTVLQFLTLTPSLERLPIDVEASSIATLPALHAAVLSERIASLTLHGALRSFKTVLQHPSEKNWYSYVVPRVLQYYDIPDLVDLAASTRIIFEE